MNARIAKKIRKLARRDYVKLLDELLHWSFLRRLSFAWFVVTHHLKTDEHIELNRSKK